MARACLAGVCRSSALRGRARIATRRERRCCSPKHDHRCSLDRQEGASAPEAHFDPAASYELKIDTDGDLEADVAFHVLFASSPGGGGAATVYRSAGAAARGTGPIGDVVIADAPVPEGGEIRVVAADGYRFCAGLRSDPFFFDGAGMRNGFQFTGTDAFADRNVFAIVLEVPNVDLGTAGPVGVWARTTAPVHGRVVQVDQAGRPGTNIIFNRAEADRAAFNEMSPAQQVASFGEKFETVIRSLGYPEAEAGKLVLGLLPSGSGTTRPPRAATPTADDSPTTQPIS